MTDREQLAQDLRAHAHEAPAVCAALMRRAANELARDRGGDEELCHSTTNAEAR